MRLLLAAALALSSGVAAAAEPPSLPDAFRSTLEQGVRDGVWASLAVGRVHDGESASWFFGITANGTPPDLHSRYELGAASEIYTGLLLAQALVTGQVRLDDRFDARWSSAGGGAVADPVLAHAQLKDLALRRVPWPAVPPNLFPRRDDDPFANYDASALDALVAHCRCSGAAGGGPLEYGLIGRLLAGQEDVGARLRERVLEPLALANTGMGDTDLQPGHAFGEATAAWHYGALAAAAGLRSDLADSLHMAQAFLRPGEDAMHQALLLARQRRGAEGALGWHAQALDAADGAWPILWNGGISGGHASFVGLRVDRQDAVILLGDGAADLSALGLALLADGAPPALPPRWRRVTQDEALPYAGLYRIAPGEVWTLRAGADGLSLQRPGQFSQRLYAFDADAFQVAGANAQLTFQREGQHVGSLLLHGSGLNLAAERLSEHAPSLPRTPSNPDSEALDACVGDYALSPLLQVRLARRGDALIWQPSGVAASPLTAYAPDRFASPAGDVDVHCLRERGGAAQRIALRLAGTEAIATRVDWSLPTPAPQGKVAPSDRRRPTP